MKCREKRDHNIPFSNIQPPSLTKMNMYEFNLTYYKYESITSNAKFHYLELSAKRSKTHNATSALILSKYEVDRMQLYALISLRYLHQPQNRNHLRFILPVN